MEMVDLLFKWVMFRIRSFVCINKGILFLFQECLNLVIILYLRPILLYYFAHIPYILVLSPLLLSVPVFCMVYRRKNLLLVSSETPIHLVEIFSRLSISLSPWRCLIRSAHYWSQNFVWIWDKGKYQPRGTSLTPTTLLLSLRYVPECIGSWIQCSPLCWSQVYPNY